MMKNKDKTRKNSDLKMNKMEDKSLIQNSAQTGWTPPNDRELIIRAKLKTGWSSKSNTSLTKQATISDTEFIEIEQVMHRAEVVEQKELNRISLLLERYKHINKPQGSGETTCIVCGTNFGLLTATPRICNDCLKNCCLTCSVDTLTTTKQTMWLCKICSEYRDLWKKSGAWFHKNLPQRLTNDSNNNKIEKKEDYEDLENKVNGDNNLNENEKLNADNISNTNLDFDGYTDDDNNNLNNHSFVQSSSPKNPHSKIKELDNVSVSTLSDNTSLKSVNTSNTKIDDYEIKKSNSFKATSEDDSSCKVDLDTEFRKYSKASQAVQAKSATESLKEIVTTKQTKKVENKDLGTLEFKVIYNSALRQLKINLISASGLPAKDANGFSDPYVKIHLLPGLARSTKLRSKTIYKTLNPKFNETLTYDAISVNDLDEKILRLTVLDEDKIGFDNIGEYRVPLKTLLVDDENYYNVSLEEIKELGDDADTNVRGKINFALKYSKNTQALYVKIIRCTQLLPMDNGKSSDPYVQITLKPQEKESKINKFKTSVKWKTLDPEYMEEFKFTNIDMKTLVNKIIEISVWDKDFGSSNDFIGVVNLGQNSIGDELKHFFAMVKNPDIYHEQWHTLKIDNIKN